MRGDNFTAWRLSSNAHAEHFYHQRICCITAACAAARASRRDEYHQPRATGAIIEEITAIGAAVGVAISFDDWQAQLWLENSRRKGATIAIGSTRLDTSMTRNRVEIIAIVLSISLFS